MSNRTFLGKVGMTPKGEWNNSTTYVRLDVVSYQGSSFIALTENRNSIPSDSNQDWMIGAKHGEFTEEQLEEFKQEVIAESLQEIDAFTDEQKQELNAYETAKESQLDTYTEGKKQEITTHTGSKINEYNENAYQKETAFNTNAANKTTTFNENATLKVGEFNTNAQNKTTDFNTNATSKETSFNENAVSKTGAFDTNATNKTNNFNQNVTSKTVDFNANALEKTDDFNENAETKTEEFDLHTVELDAKIAALKQENKDLLSSGYKLTGTGEWINLNKTSKNKFVELELEGNGKQEVRSGRNLYNYEDLFTTYSFLTANDDGSYTAVLNRSQETTGNYYEFTTNNLNLDTSTEYAIVLEVFSISNNTGVNITPVDRYGQFGTALFFKSPTVGKYIGTRESKEDFTSTHGLSSNIYVPAGVSTTIKFRISVLADTTVTTDTFEYEAFGQTPTPQFESSISDAGENNEINESIGNKNFFNIPEVTPGTSAESFNKINDNKIEIIGSLNASYRFCRIKNIRVYPNTTYYFKANYTNSNSSITTLWLGIYDENGVILFNGAYSKNEVKSINVGNSESIVVALYCTGSTAGINTATWYDIQLTTNSTDAFVPHEKQTFTAPTQQPFRRIETTSEEYSADTFEKVNGVRHEKHIIGKRIFDGTENWIMRNGVFTLTIEDIWQNKQWRKYIIVKSNYYKGIKTEYRDTIKGTDYQIARTPDTVQEVAISDSRFDNVTDFKAWLAEKYANGHSVYIEYIKNEPTYIECTAEQKAILDQIEEATSYYGQTHIYSTDETSPIFNVTAIADMNLLIDPIEARLTLVES